MPCRIGANYEWLCKNSIEYKEGLPSTEKFVQAVCALEYADYRNPLITKYVVDLGYIEQFGGGVRRVKAALEKNSNPTLELDTNGHIKLVLRPRKVLQNIA
jgi:predicted HTH transcriptional regulator